MLEMSSQIHTVGKDALREQEDSARQSLEFTSAEGYRFPRAGGCGYAEWHEEGLNPNAREAVGLSPLAGVKVRSPPQLASLSCVRL